MLEEIVRPVGIHPGLPGRDYHSPEVFELEQERIFLRGWFCVGREEQLVQPGDFLTADVAGESVILMRGTDGLARAFANVCRHRGTKLLEEPTGHLKSNAVVCPYHSWTYATDGRLIGTPNVHADDGLDRDAYGLHAIALESWDGFLFLNLSSNPTPLREGLEKDPDEPLAYERYRLGELRSARTIVYEVETNWKIVVDNYNECLHCPSVHPELVKIVPLYRKGIVLDPTRVDGGVTLADGLYTFTMDGTSTLPQLPNLEEIDRRTYYGYSVFPNLLVNLFSTGVMAYTLLPRSASHTTVISDYLFRPETIEADDFDPSDMVDFLDLVSRQDWDVCERAQRGVVSRFFDRGVYPPQDGLLHRFAERYVSERNRPLR
ncbi:MAG: glycine betaine catabolism [Actinomycetota bacterium]|jgi:Rieske 2Fe-2S family protein|nr:glycine betaine catabolism [Actinomycetota bacterium]